MRPRPTASKACRSSSARSSSPTSWVRRRRLDLLACAFIVLRLAYIALYVGDKAMARSLVWGLGLAVNIAILLLGWR